MEVNARIRKYLSHAIAEEITDEDDIFVLGVVDSLFALQLVAFVENEFSIAVDSTDLDIRNFCSIAALTSFVLRKQGITADLEPAHELPAD